MMDVDQDCLSTGECVYLLLDKDLPHNCWKSQTAITDGTR